MGGECTTVIGAPRRRPMALLPLAAASKFCVLNAAAGLQLVTASREFFRDSQCEFVFNLGMYIYALCKILEDEETCPVRTS